MTRARNVTEKLRLMERAEHLLAALVDAHTVLAEDADVDDGIPCPRMRMCTRIEEQIGFALGAERIDRAIERGRAYIAEQTGGYVPGGLEKPAVLLKWRVIR